MELALRALGVEDANQRVRRFVADQQHRTHLPLQHDVDCVCRDCERQQGASPLSDCICPSELDSSVSLVILR